MKTAALPSARIVLYALMTALTAISIDAILPGLRFIESDLGTAPPFDTRHVIVLFIFGMVFGELVIGPASDAYGRKPALVFGLAIYVAGTLTAMLAGSFETVLLGRFLQGVGVAGPKIATRATVRDQFEGDAMARVMSFMFTLIILVPLLAPALGQGVIALTGWRGVFALFLLLALCLGLWFTLRHPETLPPQNRIPFRAGPFLRNSVRILCNRRVGLLIAATGLVFGAQLLCLSLAADLFFDVYGISDTFPLYFAGLASGVGLASFANARLVARLGTDTMAGAGLSGMCLGGGLMLVAAIAWQGQPPLWVFMTLGFAVFAAIGILFGNLNAMAMRSLGAFAGLGASLIASGSSLIATLFASAVGAFHDGGVTALAAGFLLAGLGAAGLSHQALRGDSAAIPATR